MTTLKSDKQHYLEHFTQCMTWISSPPWPLPSSLFHCFLDGWASILLLCFVSPISSSLVGLLLFDADCFIISAHCFLCRCRWVSVPPPPSSELICRWLVVALLLLLSCLLVCWCLLSAAGHPSLPAFPAGCSYVAFWSSN